MYAIGSEQRAPQKPEIPVDPEKRREQPEIESPTPLEPEVEKKRRDVPEIPAPAPRDVPEVEERRPPDGPMPD
jgi:hypothetical protein